MLGKCQSELLGVSIVKMRMLDFAKLAIRDVITNVLGIRVGGAVASHHGCCCCWWCSCQIRMLFNRWWMLRRSLNVESIGIRTKDGSVYDAGQLEIGGSFGNRIPRVVWWVSSSPETFVHWLEKVDANEIVISPSVKKWEVDPQGHKRWNRRRVPHSPQKALKAHNLHRTISTVYVLQDTKIRVHKIRLSR